MASAPEPEAEPEAEPDPRGRGRGEESTHRSQPRRSMTDGFDPHFVSNKFRTLFIQYEESPTLNYTQTKFVRITNEIVSITNNVFRNTTL